MEYLLSQKHPTDTYLFSASRFFERSAYIGFRGLIVLYFYLFFISLSEILKAPIFYTTLSKYGNPKYLSIMVSLILIPMRLFSVLGLFAFMFHGESAWALPLACSSMGLIGLGLFLFVRLNKYELK